MITTFQLGITPTGDLGPWRTINPPLEWKDIELEGSFTSEYPSINLKSLQFTFVREEAAAINAYMAKGISGGNGIGEGIPIQMLPEGNATQNIFYGVIDLSTAQFEANEVKVTLRRTQDVDWLATAFKGIDFLLLKQLGYVGPPGYARPNNINGPGYEYKVTAYTITYQPELPHLLMMLLEEEALLNTLYEAIKSTAKTLKDLVSDVVLGVTALYTAVGIAKGVTDIIVLAIDIAKDIILCGSLIGQTELLMNQLGFIDKYKYCMRAADAINAAMDYINGGQTSPATYNASNRNPNPITFTSTIFGMNTAPEYGGWYVNTTHMPKKKLWQTTGISLANIKANIAHPPGDELNPELPINPWGHPDGNVYDFIQGLGKVFNARVLLIGSTANFENIHYWDNNPNYVSSFSIPNTGNPGYNAEWPQPDGTNWNELVSNYEVKFQTDATDGNTLSRYLGTTCAVQVLPTNVNNVFNLCPPGGTNCSKLVELPYALASVKSYLNLQDQVFNDIIDLVATPFNALVAVYNFIATIVNDISRLFGGINIMPTINYVWNPINPWPYLELTQDVFEVPKLFIGQPLGAPDLSGGQDASGNTVIFPLNAYNYCWQPISPEAGGTTSNFLSIPTQNWNPQPNGNNDFEPWMSATALMKLFHGLNLATPAGVISNNGGGGAYPNPTTPSQYNAGTKSSTISLFGGGNQWITYKNKSFPMKWSDFLTIITSANILTTPVGRGKFDKITYRPYDDICKSADYRVQKTYNTNLIETSSCDGN